MVPSRKGERSEAVKLFFSVFSQSDQPTPRSHKVLYAASDSISALDQRAARVIGPLLYFSGRVR